jgi:hypothetical protein
VTGPDRRTRDFAPDQARTLLPGADHYRAYVGPADQWDFMGATQFRLLTALGLRETDTVLDVGCGSLRAGRLLIPYLAVGGYHGIEPNTWPLDDAIAQSDDALPPPSEDRHLTGAVLRNPPLRASLNGGA